MDTKQIFLKAKIGDEPGSFYGRAAVYDGVPDLQGDVIVSGALSKSVRDHSGVITILAQHDPADAIGRARIVEMPDGLHVMGQLELKLPTARDAWVRLRRR